MENKEIIAKFFQDERERLIKEIANDKATRGKKKGRTVNASRLAFNLEYCTNKLMEAQRIETVV
jgi:hypothetical protein